MSKTPSMPLFCGDYLGDTMHLSLEEHGAYLKLLMVTWQNAGQALPDNDARLARILSITTGRWRKLRRVLAPFFDLSSSTWRHTRVEKEWRFVQERAAKSRENGASGGRPKLPENNDTQNPAGFSQGAQEEPTQAQAPSRKKDSEAKGASVSAGNADDLATMVEIYNKTAEEIGLPLIAKLEGSRRIKAKARLRETGLAGWTAALERLRSDACRWMRGESEKGWRADFDFLITASKFNRLVEGSYDRMTNNGQANGRPNADSRLSPVEKMYLGGALAVEQRERERQQAQRQSDRGAGHDPPIALLDRRR